MKLFIGMVLLCSSISSFAEESFQARSARIDRLLPGWARANCSGCQVVIPNSVPRHSELKIPYGQSYLQAEVFELSENKIKLFAPHFGRDQLSPNNIYNPTRARDGVRAEVDRVCKKFGPNWHVVETHIGSVSIGRLGENEWKDYTSLHQLECRKGLPTWNSVLVMVDNVGDAISAPFVNDGDRSSGKEVRGPQRRTTGGNGSRVRGQ